MENFLLYTKNGSKTTIVTLSRGKIESAPIKMIHNYAAYRASIKRFAPIFSI
jgi:hypothetical protein